MHISVETTAGLERRMTVEVPAERINQEVKTRLKSIASKARLDGFRPGKVPFAVVEQRFAGKVRAEVLGDMVRSSFHEAVAQEKLRPAGGPTIETLDEKPDKGLSYVATFEVYPEIQLAPLEGIKLEKPVVQITEQDVDAMLDKLRKQRQGWEPVERAIQSGDQLQVEFSTSIEGLDSKSAPAQQTTVILGETGIDKEIEQRLLGMHAGEEAVIHHHMPADFHDPVVAGKAVQYTVKVLAAYQPLLPDLDESFIRGLGVEAGTLEALRSEVRANMERELEQAIKAQMKQQVMDALLEANALDLPKALVDQEIDILMEQANKGRPPASEQAQAAQRPRYEANARRRVTLGLLLGEVLKTSAVKADPARVRALVESLAASYEDPNEVIKWYYASKERLAKVESLVLEDQVVDWIAERAQVSERTATFDEIMNPQQTQKG